MGGSNQKILFGCSCYQDHFLFQQDRPVPSDDKIKGGSYNTNRRSFQNHKMKGGPYKTRGICSTRKMQPLGTKKTRNLSDQKNHATSWDKKNPETSQDKSITLSIGPIASKLVQKALKCSKCDQIFSNRSIQIIIGPNGSKFVQNFPNGTKWVQVGQLGLYRSKWLQIGPQGSQIGVQNYHELNRMALKPRSPGSCFKISH